MGRTPLDAWPLPEGKFADILVSRSLDGPAFPKSGALSPAHIYEPGFYAGKRAGLAGLLEGLGVFHGFDPLPGGPSIAGLECCKSAMRNGRLQ